MTTNFKKLLCVILCIVLIAAVALFTIGCSDTTDEKQDGVEQTQGQTDEDTSDETEADEPDETVEEDGAKVVGEGQKQFDFVVVDIDGTETKFVVKTDKKTVGEALLDAKLIEGENGQYGLYVKKVNGILADYDVDQTYWGFYVDGEYAMSGVDMTDIEEGKTYSFKKTK